jgi:hypothetical protein
MVERLSNGRFPKGKGAGWGGPAKGASKARPHVLGPGPGRPTFQATAEILLREASREIQAEAVKDQIFRIALESDDDNVRVTAGKAFLDRVEGTPVARQMTISVDATQQAAIDRPPAETREEWLKRKAAERVVTTTRAAG